MKMKLSLLFMAAMLFLAGCSNTNSNRFNNPKEEDVLKIIASVDTVTNYAAVTEEHDPNNLLHKQGGYTSMVYFESSLVDQRFFDTTDVIDKGTVCGGSIEVYADEQTAKKRDDYLSTFDGTIFASGSHEVVGTIVIRISNELNATQQKELTDKIKAAFTNN